MYEVVEVDGFILTVDNLQTGNRTQLTMDDRDTDIILVCRAMTDPR